MRRKTVGALATLAVLFGSTYADAHIKLTFPDPRFAFNSNGQKTGPCGSGAPSGDVTTFTPGQVVTVTWEETINHPGHFRISIDTDGGDNFVDPTGYDDFYVDSTVVADNIEDAGGSTFSQEITIPDTPCELCSLQIIQVMTDKPPWGPGGGNDIYYWCADIRISQDAPPTSVTSGPGAGGSTSDGGASSAGGAPPSGGSSANGGASAGGNGSADGSTDDGCSCVVATNDGSNAFGGLVAVALAGLASTRRRRR